jgi:diadenosine tetraphosphatase ApaH/serine/threonine PP2A family protein phosphatase
MRSLVLSDVHSNIEALGRVLESAATAGYDRALALGDLVGYGPDPGATIAAVRALPGLVAVRGNHDRVASGLEDGGEFNNAARVAALWTLASLRPEERDFLAGLPRGPRPFADGALLSHGSPLDEDQYLLDAGLARRCFAALPFDLCFYGHTHLPGAFVMEEGRVRFEPAAGERTVLSLQPGRRYLVNPGSVGQPRDRDPRGGFAIYDEAARTVTFHRVAYPAEETRRKILAAGLPSWLGDRLLLGA